MMSFSQNLQTITVSLSLSLSLSLFWHFAIESKASSLLHWPTSQVYHMTMTISTLLTFSHFLVVRFLFYFVLFNSHSSIFNLDVVEAMDFNLLRPQ